MENIDVYGARTHNLKNISCTIPRDSLVVITGLSGSGKSSLAFDTLYAEGQRRYVESLSAYARQFLSMMEKPDVDRIDGLSPAISIEQKSTSHNPRSTVGTITEIYDYLRLLFARVGQPRCPDHHQDLRAQSTSNMVDVLMEHLDKRFMILAPIIRNRKGEHLQLLQKLQTLGFVRVRVDGVVVAVDEVVTLEKNVKHTIEAVVDRVRIQPAAQQRLAESLESAVNLADGLAIAVNMDEEEEEIMFSSRYACNKCGYSLLELEPRLFSFNNPNGACPTCDGLGKQQTFDEDLVVIEPDATLAQGAIAGWSSRNQYTFSLVKAVAQHYEFDIDIPFSKLSAAHQKLLLYGTGRQSITFVYENDSNHKFETTHAFEGVIPNFKRRYRETESASVREELQKYISVKPCATCQGSRLRREAINVFVAEHNLPQITAMSIEEAVIFFDNVVFTGNQQTIAQRILKEINARLRFLNNVGLNYLSLSRSADTLSGGEAQRIRLASQIGSGLVGVMYVLDEPSIGLHQRDNARLLQALCNLRDLGNTVIVVEHDEEAIRTAQYVIDIGPGAGVHGGTIVAQGTPEQIAKNPNSITGAFLRGSRYISIPATRRPIDADKWICLNTATGNNLQHVDLRLPVGVMTCVTGVSGSGKSTLINQTLYPIASAKLMGSRNIRIQPHQSITGLEHFDKVINIDQGPIGRTPRSNPATYTGVFTPIRELFAATQEARSRGYQPGRFSFNVKGGRCEQCQGGGMIKVEMHFLADVYVACDVCQGMRYGRETLDVLYKGKNIAQVLAMTVEQSQVFFAAVPSIKRKLDTMLDVGLGYITLGQSATTLSGGEAQRVKLSKELARQNTGKTLYILDEPTTGLHFHDIEQLLRVIQVLTDQGNTVVIIEHNLDVVKTADWVVDLGPEGGNHGGQIIACGRPEDIVKNKHSHTGNSLAPLLNAAARRRSQQFV